MFSERLQKLAASPLVPKLKMHDIRIYFEAPKPTDATTITKEKEDKFEANFQWVSFTALVQDLRDESYYIYRVNLQPWGDSKGDATIIGSNSAMKPDETVEIRISAEDVEKTFKNIVGKPNLFPSPAIQVVYVNINKTDMKNPQEGKEYGSDEFKRNFGTDFYVVLRKDHKFQNPLGKIIGVKGEPVKASIITKKFVTPDGRKLVVDKPRGTQQPTRTIQPKKGPGSYRRQRWMPMTGFLRDVANAIKE
jgi:hypothetical protein